MKKKIIKIVTILIILSAIILLNKETFAGTYTDGTNGTYEYEIISETDKTVKIVKYTEGISKEITIPSKINDYTVITIGGFGNTNLEKVIIPNSVTIIETRAFSFCRSLEEIELPNTITEIGFYAFEFCKNLTKINFPSSITYIGQNAFSYCENLTKIEIPNSITNIDWGTFIGCWGLHEVTFSKNIEKISGSAFMECDSLTEIELPNSVTYIGMGAFDDCSNLKKIIIPKSVIKIDDGDGEFFPPFDGCNEDFTIYCYKGSYAEEYAISHNIKYVIISQMTINETSKIIKGIDVNNSKVNKIKEKIEELKRIVLENILKVTNSVGTELTGEDIVGTGTIVKIKEGTEEKEYTVLIYGDCNGDGKINAIDALAVIKNKTEAIKFTKEIFEEAGRIISKTGTPSAIDALAIIKHALGVQIINQEK